MWFRRFGPLWAWASERRIIRCKSLEQADMRRVIALLVLALAAQAAGAQIYRSVLPDGSIVYSDKPTPGARDARELDLPPPNVALPEPAASPAPPRPAGASEGATPAARLDDAQQDYVRASQALDAARAALEAGREPQAGETMGTAIPGRARRTEAYEQRIRSLEDAVARAQKRLDEALERRNAAR